MLHLAILKQKLQSDNENSVRQGILFEWAALGDLEDFLNFGFDEHGKKQIYIFVDEIKAADLGPESGHIFASHIFDQAYKLASAVKWLHNGEGGKYAAHMDIKPRNILVCASEEGYPVGKWKLSDFGITHVRPESSEVALPHYLRKLGVPDFRPRAGTYQPPYQDQVSDESRKLADVWALGCVLEELLAFAIGRREAVQTLRESRRKQGGGSDFFYYQRKGKHSHTRTEFNLQTLTVPHWAQYVRSNMKSMRAIQPLHRPTMDTVVTQLLRIRQYLREWSDSSPLPAVDEPASDSEPEPGDVVQNSSVVPRNTGASTPPSQRSASPTPSSQTTPATTITATVSALSSTTLTFPSIKDWEPKVLNLHSWLNSHVKQDIEVVAVAPNHDGKSVAVLTRYYKVCSVKILSLHPTKDELNGLKKLTVEPLTLKISNATNIVYCGNVLCVWGTIKGAQLTILKIDEEWNAHSVPVPELPSALNGLQHVVVTKSGSTVALQCDEAILVCKIAGHSMSLKSVKPVKGYHFKTVALDPAGTLLYAWAFAQGNNHDRLYMWSIQSHPPLASQPPFREYSRVCLATFSLCRGDD